MRRANQASFMKQMREASGLSRNEVCKYVGVSVDQYGNWERGTAYVTKDKVWLVVKAWFSKSESANVNTFGHASNALIVEMSKDWKQSFIDEIDKNYMNELNKPQ